MAITHISQFIEDPHNARKHNPANLGMIERSINEVGTGRSLVIDEDGVILAGNATKDAAIAAGIEKVVEVESDGETLIVVRRRGLTKEQKIKLALADNRTAELATWDTSVLAGLQLEAPEVFEGLWSQEEQEKLFKAKPDAASADQGEMLDPVQDAETSKSSLTYLHFARWEIPLTESEIEDLSDMVNEWVDQTGTLYGFIANLVTRVRP